MPNKKSGHEIIVGRSENDIAREFGVSFEGFNSGPGTWTVMYEIVDPSEAECFIQVDGKEYPIRWVKPEKDDE